MWLTNLQNTAKLLMTLSMLMILGDIKLKDGTITIRTNLPV